MEWPELAYAHTYAHDENRNSHGRTTDARTCGCGLFAKDAEKATTYVRYGDSDHSPRHVTTHLFCRASDRGTVKAGEGERFDHRAVIKTNRK